MKITFIFLFSLLLSGCFEFEFNTGINTDIINAKADTTSPILSELSPIGQSLSDRPKFEFSSSEAGNIAFQGSCQSKTSTAVRGNNRLYLQTLAAGHYSDCLMTVSDAAGNVSEPLTISAFDVAECLSCTGYFVEDINNESNYITAMLMDDEDNIYLAGYTGGLGTYQLLFMRRHIDGSVDTDFATNGQKIMAVGSNNYQINNLLFADDETILAYGYGQFAGISQPFLLRLKTDGSVDTTFADAGVLAFPVGSVSSAPKDIIQLADGKLLLLGSFVNDVNTEDVFLARLMPDGSLDTVFADQGFFRHTLNNSYANEFSLAISPGGAIYIAVNQHQGSAGEDIKILRLLADGKLDTDFGQGTGIVVVDFNNGVERPTDMVFTAEGKLLVVGHQYSSGLDNDVMLVMQLLADGQLDNDFGVQGKVEIANNLYPKRVFIDAQQRIVLPGFNYTNSGSDIYTTRLLPNGSIDTSFGNLGYSQIDFNGTRELAYDALLQPDGKLLISGAVQDNDKDNLFVLRLDEDGQLDSKSFAP
ncbi:MAG: hypothetical protein HRU20_13110 [Pseudomonadales bacterium]|nr:hypothetical protein [Pseudomonadales bacterium]